ncbi:hypothetical protein BU16DRAFT_558502 [Lophium mytilinum]|uniref:Uncharacterized protein n=1 Tax=Lophium mytilinum TaxID=390894 RepID=A0A6A6R223_9PEZI|nr:hypothetical protein BU16DRAFT_558502 [Lophium mytilinum]
MSDALVQLAENVVLLQRLNPEPGKAGTNSPPDLPSGRRTLSMRHEQAILESLSFLLASSDKPDRILALCIEEKRNPPGMILSYAVNIDGQEVLRVGINGITKILEAESYEHDERNGIALRDQIVSHSQSRLLRRLDSKHQLASQRKLTPKVSVAILLRRALESIISSHRALPRDHEALWPLARSLENHHLRLEKLPTKKARSQEGLSLLKGILETSATICTYHTHGLKSVLDLIPSKAPWDASTKANLTRKIEKLGHYHSATDYLLSAASRFSIFHSIEVQYVPLRPADLRNGSINSNTPGLLSRYLHGQATAIDDAAVKRLRQRNLIDLTAVRDQVQNQVRKTQFRVHAEMKLLLYYERQQSKDCIPPRVIVSSKSACFLCDLYFKLHGGFYMPKTHGTLYEKWTLPDMDQLELLPPRKRENLDSVLVKLNTDIERRIFESIEAGPLAREHPNESMIFSFPSFTSPPVSATSTNRPQSEAPDQEQATDDFDPLGSRVTNLRTTVSDPVVSNSLLSSHNQPGLSRLDEVSSQEAKDAVAVPLRTDSMFSPPPFIPSPTLRSQNDLSVELIASKEIIHLSPGIIHRRILTEDSPPIRFHSQHIHVELSRSCTEHLLSLDTDSESSGTAERADLCVAVELFTPDRASRAVDDLDPYIVDMRSDWKKLSAPSGAMYTPHGLLLRKRGDVVALRVDLDYNTLS